MFDRKIFIQVMQILNVGQEVIRSPAEALIVLTKQLKFKSAVVRSTIFLLSHGRLAENSGLIYGINGDRFLQL